MSQNRLMVPWDAARAWFLCMAVSPDRRVHRRSSLGEAVNGALQGLFHQ
ncbi:MAG: hypothetical protein HRU71_10065 [Planctomycetia bacterium]|nr:MAG: hypothetical protein HRU71_10065 [Planctomycetia bacterium]